MGSLRHRIVAPLRRQPVWYPLLLRLRPGMRTRLTGPSTDVVIDGYLRSANTFAYHAFTRVNPDARVAHHLHSPVQLTRAARLGVPALLLIRDPADAVSSAVVQAPSLSPRTALREWIAFHRMVWHVRDHYVIGSFDEVRTHFAAVVQRLNRAFGTSFAFEVDSETHTREVFDTIDRDFRERHDTRSDEEVEAFIGRPSAQRTTSLREVRLALDREGGATGDLAAARALYADFLAEAERQAQRLDS